MVVDYKDPTHITDPDPIDYSKLSSLEKKFIQWLREKMYGEDVREAIARAVAQVFADSYDIKTKADALDALQTKLIAEFKATIGGLTKDSEVINARIGSNGVVYKILQDRLNAEFERLSQVLVSGQRNLVYNSNFDNQADGWNLFDNGYLSNDPASMYGGSWGLGLNVSGKGQDWTLFAESRLTSLMVKVNGRTDNTYSMRARVKLYADSSKEAYISAEIAYYDATGKRIAVKGQNVGIDSKETWVDVRVEDFKVPDDASFVAMQFHGFGDKVNGMVAQPMITFGPKVGIYNQSVPIAIESILENSGQTNLVYNSDFKYGVEGWDVWGTGGSWTETEGRNGSNGYTVKINGATADGYAGLRMNSSKALSVIKGASYSASTWVKATKTDNQAGFELVWTKPDGSRARNDAAKYGDTNGNWKQLKLENIIPPDGAVNVTLNFWVIRNGEVTFSQPMLVKNAPRIGLYSPGVDNSQTITPDKLDAKTAEIYKYTYSVRQRQFNPTATDYAKEMSVVFRRVGIQVYATIQITILKDDNWHTIVKIPDGYRPDYNAMAQVTLSSYNNSQYFAMAYVNDNKEIGYAPTPGAPKPTTYYGTMTYTTVDMFPPDSDKQK